MPSHLKKVVKTFTHSQILAFPTSSPITLVPGRTNQVVIPIQAIFAMTVWAADYTNIDGTTHVVNIDDGNSDFWNSTKLNTSTVFAPGHVAWTYVAQQSGGFKDTLTVQQSTSNILGNTVSLVVANGASGAYTGGDSTNIFQVTLWYTTARG